jgi:hypothetical protein
MRHGSRAMVAMLGLVLGLHVFMLAGLGTSGSHDPSMPAAQETMRMQAAGPTGQLAEPAPLGHDMAAACLAVLAGLLLLGVGRGRTGRWRAPEQRRWPAARPDPPPSPVPIALGIQRT